MIAGAADLEAADPVVADHLGKTGAEQLAARIRQYWAGLGHAGVSVCVEPVSRGAWSVRSNLKHGLPPPA